MRLQDVFGGLLFYVLIALAYGLWRTGQDAHTIHTTAAGTLSFVSSCLTWPRLLAHAIRTTVFVRGPRSA